MDLVSLEDLESAMALTTLDTDAKVAAEAILEGLEGDLRSFLGRPLIETTVEDEAVRPTSKGTLNLRKTPVVSVSEFSVDGTVIDPADYVVRPWGITGVYGIVLAPVTLTAGEPIIRASYVGGLPGNDDESEFFLAAKPVILRAASRDLNQFVRQDAAGLRTLSVEGTSMAFIGSGGLLDSEKDSLRRWKKRTVRT